MKKEYDFSKLKERKNLYPRKKKALGIEPEVLRVIGEESTRKGTASLSSRQIDSIISAARSGKKARRKRTG